MKGTLHKISCILGLMLIFSLILPSLVYSVNAKDRNIGVEGKFYEFDENNKYKISSCEEVQETINSNTLGEFSVSGSILRTSKKGDIPSYEVKNCTNLLFYYTYDDSLLIADKKEWHLAFDDGETVDGIKLNSEIGKGVIILQTSLDGEKWVTVQKQTNIFKDVPVQTEFFYETSDIQLMNGCYYKIIVAYETEIEVEPSKILFITKSNYEYKKYAEVYKFYAVYNGAEKYIVDNERKFSLGNLVKTGTDNGYSGAKDITINDLHYGWKLGSFFVSGYTEKTDNLVFLKNVGDKIMLWFNLEQDIANINGNKNLSIVRDIDGYDQAFQTKRTDFGYGTLIIRYTNHEGVQSDPIIYTNYLESFASAGANTKVQLFEEGDYEVALDYKIKKENAIIDDYEDYRISFTFKVRNGNCMVYPFDVNTKVELANNAFTENGFYLDLARSRYLKINVKMSRWTRGTSGYVEDIRYNRPAKDGEAYTGEGIYTITVSNPSTGQSTEKKIYVGKDNILKASINANNASYTINEIANFVENGARITDNGTIIFPVVTTEPKVTETLIEPTITEPVITEMPTAIPTVVETTADAINASGENKKNEVTPISVNNKSEVSEDVTGVPTNTKTSDEGSRGFLIYIVIGIAVGGIIVFVTKKGK